jgi:ATP-binding cassette subfamily E protein 1
MVRVAVIDRDRCKPKECDQPCMRYCPPVRSRIEAIRFDEDQGKPIITESLCTGCGICVKKCPFHCITVVNLPEELEGECSHRYGQNMFKLYRLPIPQEGIITGLIGRNGTGKSTALKILSGEIKPNLGRSDSPPGWPEIIKRHRGSVLQNYFERLSKDELKVVHKPQYVDMIPKRIKGKVTAILEKTDERGILSEVLRELQITSILDRQIGVLSGGELQAVSIAAAICRNADVYIFDEPSSHLDVSQRMRAARLIRSLVDEKKIVILSEHDLAMLDYLSDQVCVLYGASGVYGIVSHVHGVRIGVNIFLNGFISDENMRFRSEAIRFHVKPPREMKPTRQWGIEWDAMGKCFRGFSLQVEQGNIKRSEVVGIVGPNGIGKTTFVKLLAGLEKPDKGQASSLSGLSISYKPQYISAEYKGSVNSLLLSIAGERYETDYFRNEIVRPLGLEPFMERDVKNLSGGELQRVAVGACLAKKAQLYLLDEPSAYLDVEERLAVAKAVRKIVDDNEAFAYVVEHDIAIQDFMADRLMIFSGTPGVNGTATSPSPLREGMNRFLQEMDITFRRDPETGRPRVNKTGSKTDRTQRELGEYYYVPEKGKE